MDPAPEQLVRVGDVDVCYQVLDEGVPEGAPIVVLVMGLGLQLVWWRDDFCRLLTRRGLRVVRLDNRDVGRSSRVEGPGITAAQLLTRRARPVYGIEDMADDVAGVLRHVAPTGGHLVGASLGASVVQEAAVRHPDVVRSVVSVMGRPGDRRSGRTSWRTTVAMLRPAPRSPAGEADDLVRAFARIGSLGRTREDEDDVREAVRRSSRRLPGPDALGPDAPGNDGAGRQLAALVAERDRTPDLARLRVPLLALHGTRDRVIAPSGSVATAAAVPGAELLLVDGMGHDLPRWTWPAVVDGIARTVARADP